MNKPRLAVVGAKGRMGQTLCSLASAEGFELIASIDQGEDLNAAVDAAEVIIEFSFHEVSAGLARLCEAQKKPLVIGTTGHSAGELEAIRACARGIPLVLAPNYSVGVNTLFWLTRKATEILGPGFDLEVVEMHHHLKKDAPSGTAKRLAEILCEVRDLQYEQDVRHGRKGLVGERTSREIGMHALRGGDVVGDHTVVFAVEGERVELTHKASSRATFALGALRAAHWALQQNPGLYDMQDVLGLR